MAKGVKYTNQPLGTFDGLRHYIDPVSGNYIVSGLGGTTKELIDKHLPRTVENYTEFGNCVQWTKLIRLNMEDIIHLAWGNYTSWINKMGKTIQKKDLVGVRGERGVMSSKCKSLLTSLNFNAQHPFKQVLTRDPEVIADEDRKTITVNISNFCSKWELNWPRNFQYYRLSLQIGQLSDLHWSSSDKKLMPEYVGAQNHRVVVRSEWLTKNTDPVNLTLTASFRDNQLPQENVTVLVGLGIEIGKDETPGTVSFYKGDGTMALIACL